MTIATTTSTELRFRAMGSDCHLVLVGDPALAGGARARIDDLERKWSRFIDDSEVSRLNRAAGRPVRVSPVTVELVVRAVEAWRLSGGAFDPTVLGAVLRAGYARSFDQLGAPPSPEPSLLGIGAGDIVVDGDSVCLPAGTGFDPGGIGKGLAADTIAAEAVAAGAEGVCVNMGGDVRVRGAGPDGGTWTVGVEHPWSAEPLVRLGLADGAVATSTTLLRRWVSEGVPRHHLIDPQTGVPSETDTNLSTVVAGQAWVAEVLAKAVLLRGSAHPFDILGGTGAEGLVVDGEGRVQTSAGLARYLGGHSAPDRLRRAPGAAAADSPTGQSGLQGAAEVAARCSSND
jgi:FAD:protein FMN transferase